MKPFTVLACLFLALLSCLPACFATDGFSGQAGPSGTGRTYLVDPDQKASPEYVLKAYLDMRQDFTKAIPRGLVELSNGQTTWTERVPKVGKDVPETIARILVDMKGLGHISIGVLNDLRERSLHEEYDVVRQGDKAAILQQVKIHNDLLEKTGLWLTNHAAGNEVLKDPIAILLNGQLARGTYLRHLETLKKPGNPINAFDGYLQIVLERLILTTNALADDRVVQLAGLPSIEPIKADLEHLQMSFIYAMDKGAARLQETEQELNGLEQPQQPMHEGAEQDWRVVLEDLLKNVRPVLD